MKQTLTIMLALASMMSASAATNLLPSLQEPQNLYTGTFPSSHFDPTAEVVQQWLGSQTDGWYKTLYNGQNQWWTAPVVNGNTLVVPDAPGTDGSMLGVKFTIDNETLQDLSSLTLAMHWQTSGESGAFAYSLWYENLEGSLEKLFFNNRVWNKDTDWDISASLNEQQLTSLKGSANGTFYLVLDVHGANNDNENSIISDMYLGETASVPEPATATLGLLGLGSLMLRRRRKD